MRRLTAFCFLLLLLLATGGRSLLFRLQLAEVRAEMREALQCGAQPDGAETFRFEAAALKKVVWLDDGKEFEWNGTRYDVLTLKGENATTIISAIPDHRESRLVSRCQDDQRDEHLPSKSLQKLLSVPYLAPQELVLAAPIRMVTDFPRPAATRALENVCVVPTPPPIVLRPSY